MLFGMNTLASVFFFVYSDFTDEEQDILAKG